MMAKVEDKMSCKRQKVLNNRLKVLIENGVEYGHRTMFVIVGDKAKDQVVFLHHMFTKAKGKANPTVLWCFKDLGFDRNHIKKMKRKMESGKVSLDEGNLFQQFITSAKIRFCHYSESEKILGKTYSMCVLQDFEALTPNLLARTIETVEGGGLVIILLDTVHSLDQLDTMNMDVHQKYRTEAHQDIVCRFNKRFSLSLADCKRCLVVDDQLTVLPISSRVKPSETCAPTSNQGELDELKGQLQDTQPVGSLVNLCKTLDQASALLKFVDAVTEKAVISTVSLTASRGRGKSATLGLAVSAAVAFGYLNIYVTSPSPENLNTFFQFVLKGFDALEYKEGKDYTIETSKNPEFNNAIINIIISRDHRQLIQYIHPTDSQQLSQVELLVIDEAAAIPLPLVKQMLGPYLVFLASTINGYEGTGRSLSLKLLQQLRTLAVPDGTNTNAVNKKDFSAAIGKKLYEISLEEPIRYKAGDDVESWLIKLLCLDSTSVAPIPSGCPLPDICSLYYINRGTLFSYEPASEKFLQRLVALYVSSHYKNTPNDLQMMADSPSHHLFCLLGPINPNKNTLPEVLVFIQVCLEGGLSKKTITEGFSRGTRASGDLIPWTISQQYQNPEFGELRGARIVRIATHPDYQGMGYGSKALSLLKDYYGGQLSSLEEDDDDTDQKKSETILLRLSERVPERLDYIGVSFGLTNALLKFWKRGGFLPVYLCQTTNSITGEHTCIMINVLGADGEGSTQRVTTYWRLFRMRFIDLLSKYFHEFPTSLAYQLLTDKNDRVQSKQLSRKELDRYLASYNMKRLELYGKNLADYRQIRDLIPKLAKLYYINQLTDIKVVDVQANILLGMGLQYKSLDTLEKELDRNASQLLALFNRLVKRCVNYLNGIVEQDIEKSLGPQEDILLQPETRETLDEELSKGARKLEKAQKAQLKLLNNEYLAQFAIKGSEDDWDQALSTNKNNIISVKRKRIDKEAEPSKKPVKKKKKSTEPFSIN